EIEKGALRPFLFGKDVGRWAVDWKRTSVMFPYGTYLKKAITSDGGAGEWNLIPCKANIKKFHFANPEKVELFEDRFPKAWKYLMKHEPELRSREDGRYEDNKPDGHVWYGGARAQNLEYYCRPKLVLQLLSRRNSGAFDRADRF